MKQESSVIEKKTIFIQQQEQYPSQWYGQIKFKPSMTHKIVKKIVSQQEQNVIMQKQWQVNSGKKQPNWQTLFIHMNECHSRTISFTKSFNLAPFISVPFYVTLTILRLNDNDITNVQFLSWLKAPLLQELKLENNSITTVKSIAKLNFKKHNLVKLSQNPLFDINLSRFFIEFTVVARGIDLKKYQSLSRSRFQQIHSFQFYRNEKYVDTLNIISWRINHNEKKELKRIRRQQHQNQRIERINRQNQNNHRRNNLFDFFQGQPENQDL